MNQGKPKRILIFSFAYYPRFIGGAEVAIKEITDRISPAEVEFDLIALRLDSNLPKFEKIGNVNVYRVGWSLRRDVSTDSLPWYLHLNKYAYLLTGLVKAIKLNKTRNYDATWSIMATYSSFTAVLFKFIKPKIPYMLTLQDGDPIPYLKRRALPMYPLFLAIFRKANIITAISQYLADWARDMGAKCPIEIVPNAVDVKLFAEKISDGEANQLKNDLGKKSEDIFLITTSRLVQKNGVGDIIDALRYLPAHIRFLILGQGYLEGTLKNQCKENGISFSDRKNPDKSARVNFLGFVAHKGMPKYLQISDIFIRPSLSEGLGNSFLEAMAAGVPVIATPVGGIPDFLVDGETGLFCEVNNSHSIVRKIDKLIKDRESREYIVKKAADMVNTKYRWEVVVNKMRDVFKTATRLQVPGSSK